MPETYCISTMPHPLVETGPRVTLEAMAARLAIIGTKEGLGEYCDPNGGRLIKEADISDWITKIETLTKNPGLRMQMGQYNRRRVEEHFSKVRQLNNEEILLKTLLMEKIK